VAKSKVEVPVEVVEPKEKSGGELLKDVEAAEVKPAEAPAAELAKVVANAEAKKFVKVELKSEVIINGVLFKPGKGVLFPADAVGAFFHVLELE
jgi:hypothetical protein